MNKYIGIIVTLALALIAGMIGYGRLQEKAETTKEKVEKHEEQIYAIKEIDVRQSMIMERNTQLIEKLEKKL